MGLFGGVGNPAGQLFHVELTISNSVQCENLTGAVTYLLDIESEPAGRFVAELNRAPCKIDGSPIQAAGCARFEPARLKTHLLQARA